MNKVRLCKLTFIEEQNEASLDLPLADTAMSLAGDPPSEVSEVHVHASSHALVSTTPALPAVALQTEHLQAKAVPAPAAETTAPQTPLAIVKPVGRPAPVEAVVPPAPVKAVVLPTTPSDTREDISQQLRSDHTLSQPSVCSPGLT